jgi:hypothetical protein
MTDLEITRLCAEAMGFEYRVQEKSAHYSEGVYSTKYGEDVYRYKPLHDDAQAMALVKRYPVEAFPAIHDYADAHLLGKPYDLNRAICECVARLQSNRTGG